MIHLHIAGIYAASWQNGSGRLIKVCGWKTKNPAALITVNNSSFDGVNITKQFVGFQYIALPY